MEKQTIICRPSKMSTSRYVHKSFSSFWVKKVKGGAKFFNLDKNKEKYINDHFMLNKPQNFKLLIFVDSLFCILWYFFTLDAIFIFSFSDFQVVASSCGNFCLLWSIKCAAYSKKSLSKFFMFNKGGWKRERRMIRFNFVWVLQTHIHTADCNSKKF